MTRSQKNSNVLVTGGAGFIGSVLCRRLHEAGHRVVALDDLSRGRRDYLPQGIDFAEGDIRDSQRVRSIISTTQPEVVVHLAAMHFIPDCIARPAETMDVNVEGTRRVLDCCRNTTVRHVMFASTAAVYAPSDEACIENVTPLGPLEVYGTSKLEGESLVRAFSGETGISATILRLFNAIGPNETNPHVLPHIFESLQSSDTVKLGNITPRRDYIDTRDIAGAILALMDRDGGVEIVNVGTGVTYSVAEILDHLSSVLGRRIVVETEPGRVRTSDRMMLLADIARITQLTSWMPQFALDDTLRKMVDAYGIRVERTARPAG